MRSDLVDVEVTVHHETAKAVLVSNGDDLQNAKWIRKSQCKLDDRAGAKTRKLTMPERVAIEKGLV